MTGEGYAWIVTEQVEKKTLKVVDVWLKKKLKNGLCLVKKNLRKWLMFG